MSTLKRLACVVAALTVLTAAFLPRTARAEPVGTANEDLLLDCKTSEVFIVHAAAGQPGFSCVEMSRDILDLDGQRFIFRVVRDKGLDPKTADIYAKMARDTIKAAAEVYYGIGDWRLGHISLIIEGEHVANGGNIADTNELTASECAIRLYLKGINAQVAAGTTPFENTIAHELFHCVQQFTVPEQAALYETGAKWWVEGSAEFMSHLVVPDEVRMKGIAEKFDEVSGTMPLTSIAYSAYIFFSWLHGEDPKLIEKVIRAMPAGTANAGEEKQQAALRQALGDEALERYALDYLSGKILDPVGRPVGENVLWGAPIIIDKAGETPIAAKPFTIARARLQWQDGDYLLAKKTSSMISFKMRDGADAPWADMPDEIVTDCAEPRILDLGFFPLEAKKANFQISSIRTRSCEVCEVSQKLDACVIGDWRIDNDALLAVLANQIDKKDGSFFGITGTGAAKFRKDQSGAFLFDKLKIWGRMKEKPGESASSPGANITVTAEGSDTGNWSAEDGVLTFCVSVGSVLFTASIDIDGPVGPQSVTSLGVVQSGKFDYACTKDELTLTWAGSEMMSDGTKPRWVLTKAP